MRTIQVFASLQVISHRVSLHFISVDPDGARSVFGPAAWVCPVEEGVETAPTFSLRVDEAQQLMDELWRVGLRPSAGSGSAGAMAAVQAHLADMRALVFKGDASFRPTRGEAKE
jgi:hypothetical protein